MKKLFFALVIMLTSTTTFSFVYRDNQPSDELIFCPDKIECTQDGNIKSCSTSGNNLEYWDIQNLRVLPANSKIIKGVYTVSAIYSRFATPMQVNTYCEYKKYDEDKKILLIVTALRPILEPIYDKKYSWIDNKGEHGEKNTRDEHNGSCFDDHVNQCPFQKRASVLFINNRTSNQIASFSINGIPIYDSTGVLLSRIPFGLVDISYRNILDICGGVKECKIDLLIEDPLVNRGGSVFVDLSRRMEITHTASSSPDILEKIEPFNMILVR